MTLSIQQQIEVATRHILADMVTTGVESGLSAMEDAGHSPCDILRSTLRAVLLTGFERGACLAEGWRTAGYDPIPVIARVRDASGDPGGHDLQRMVALATALLKEAEGA